MFFFLGRGNYAPLYQTDIGPVFLQPTIDLMFHWGHLPWLSITRGSADAAGRSNPDARGRWRDV